MEANIGLLRHSGCHVRTIKLKYLLDSNYEQNTNFYNKFRENCQNLILN